ncbi:MAG: hypothetical protein HZB86_12010 [Deltaproteobacteria bacterium]|nr:hypothetical protein [Deltaproteobacteria bacterium]
MERDCGERRTGLKAVGSGKGTGGWDGVERRKPRAVIGIPYSSDVARATEADGEEIAVKAGTSNALFIGVAAGVAIFLSVCVAL